MSAISRQITRGITWPIVAALGDDPEQGGTVAPTQAIFLARHTADGNVPDYIGDFDNNLFWFNGAYYTSLATYQAASGPTQGTGFVPKAAMGSGAPYTVRIKATLPASINASRETLVMFRGSTSANFASLRLDNATPSAQLRVTTAGTVYMGAGGVQTPISASSLGSSCTFAATFDNASGASDKKINVTNIGKVPQQNGVACTLSSLSTGMYIGWDPDNPGSSMRGTINLVVVWGAKNLANGAVRALSTDYKYGRGAVSCSGGGRDLNVGNGYTWVSRAGADGDPIIFEVRNDNGEVTKIKSITGTAMTQDDHQTGNLCLTDDGGVALTVNPHDTGNVIFVAKCADLNLDNFSARSAVTLGSGYIPAYNFLRKRASNGDLHSFFRTNQTFWNYTSSTDDGATWPGSSSKRLLDDSATHAADKLLISGINEVSDGVFRCIANREPQYLDTEIRMFDLNVATDDITAGGASIGTAGVGNGAPMNSCQRIWNPPTGFSAFGRDFKVWYQGLAGLLDETSSIQSFYWLRCNNQASPWSEAAWDKVLICADEVTGRSGGGCVVGLASLTYPTVAISRYLQADSLYHLEIWEATDAAGSAWVKVGELATGDASSNNTLVTPTSAPGAASLVSVTWNYGVKTSFTSFSQNSYWAQTLGA